MIFKRKRKTITIQELASIADSLGKLQGQRVDAIREGTPQEYSFYNVLIRQTLERATNASVKEQDDIQT